MSEIIIGFIEIALVGTAVYGVLKLCAVASKKVQDALFRIRSED